MWQLRNATLGIPGNFCYTQTEGIINKFAPSFSIAAQAAIVRNFRAGNKLPRTKYNECVEDIDFFNCQRLHFDTKWCGNTDKGDAEVPYHSSALRTPCHGCGAHL